MAKIDFGAAENLVRIGLLLVFTAIVFLLNTSFDDAAKLFFWVALIVLFIETFKLPSLPVVNGALAQILLSITMVIASGKGLYSALGKTFTEYHITLILFIIGGLIILYGAYKKLNAEK